RSRDDPWSGPPLAPLPPRAGEEQVDIGRRAHEARASGALRLQGLDAVGAGPGQVLEVDAERQRARGARTLELGDLEATEPAVQLDDGLRLDRATDDLERHSLLLRRHLWIPVDGADSMPGPARSAPCPLVAAIVKLPRVTCRDSRAGDTDRCW